MVVGKGHTPNAYVVESDRYRPLSASPQESFEILAGEDLLTAMKRNGHGPGKVAKAFECLPPGHFHPRIFRHSTNAFGQFRRRGVDWGWPPVNEPAMIMALRQLKGLHAELSRVYRYIEPSGQENLNAYGLEVRQLLILACTEVESLWKGALEENGVSVLRLDTSTYVKLKDPLRLSEYTLSLPLYPGVDPVSPFREWDGDKPTQSLRWYDAYNAVKHHGEKNLARATVLHATEAVVAAVILVQAQFGPTELFEDLLGAEFSMVSMPELENGPHYLSSVGTPRQWTPVQFQF